MFDVIKEILISEKQLPERNLIESDGGMYLTVGTLLEINNIITDSNNITLKHANAKPYGFDKMYMGKEFIEDKLYQIINHFNERKITSKTLHSILFSKMHPFYDSNGIACEILFANDDILRHNIQTNLYCI